MWENYICETENPLLLLGMKCIKSSRELPFTIRERLYLMKSYVEFMA